MALVESTLKKVAHRPPPSPRDGGRETPLPPAPIPSGLPGKKA